MLNSWLNVLSAESFIHNEIKDHSNSPVQQIPSSHLSAVTQKCQLFNEINLTYLNSSSNFKQDSNVLLICLLTKYLPISQAFWNSITSDQMSKVTQTLQVRNDRHSQNRIYICTLPLFLSITRAKLASMFWSSLSRFSYNQQLFLPFFFTFFAIACVLNVCVLSFNVCAFCYLIHTSMLRRAFGSLIPAHNISSYIRIFTSVIESMKKNSIFNKIKEITIKNKMNLFLLRQENI